MIRSYSQPVALTAESHARSPMAGARRLWLARPPEWLWAGVIAVQVAFAALLTSYTFFFFDDFLFLQQARTQGFGLGYLRESMFEHFSPVARLLNKIVVDIGPSGFGFAHALQLVLYGFAVLALAFVVRTILGRTWAALALTILFGQSVFLMRLLTWWTATGNLLPATMFVLLAIGCYLRWWQGGGRWWFLGSIASFVGGLLDYETAMLFPLFLLLIRLLVLEDSLDPRVWIRSLWRERWMWLTLIALDAAALINFYTKYYIQMPRPTAGQLLHFIEISLVQTFIPALLGVSRTPTPGTGAVVAAVLVFSALVAVTVYLRPRAWRCLLGALIAFLAALLPVGLNRIRRYGVYDGSELYYQQAAQFMFFVFWAFALSPRWGGRRERTVRLPSVPILAGVAGAAAIAYGLLYVGSVHAVANAYWEPHTSRSYFRQFSESVDRIKRVTGQEPNLVDTTVWTNVMAANFYPFNRYSQFFPFLSPGLRYDDASAPTYAVSLTGQLQPVHLKPIAGARLRLSRVSNISGANLRPARLEQAGVCVPSGPVQRLHVPLSQTASLTVAPPALPYAVEVSYQLPVRTNVVVMAARPGESPVVLEDQPHYWGPGLVRGLTPVESQALAGRAVRAGEIDLDLPGGSCVTTLTVGVFVPRG